MKAQKTLYSLLNRVEFVILLDVVLLYKEFSGLVFLRLLFRIICDVTISAKVSEVAEFLSASLNYSCFSVRMYLVHHLPGS